MLYVCLDVSSPFIEYTSRGEESVQVMEGSVVKSASRWLGADTPLLERADGR